MTKTISFPQEQTNLLLSKSATLKSHSLVMISVEDLLGAMAQESKIFCHLPRLHNSNTSCFQLLSELFKLRIIIQQPSDETKQSQNSVQCAQSSFKTNK
jgi:hypothetical protein